MRRHPSQLEERRDREALASDGRRTVRTGAGRRVLRSYDREGSIHPVDGERGFTIGEVIVILVIVGVIAGIMTPLFSSGRWRADSAVQEIAMGLNGAQRLAVLRQHDVIITFALANRDVVIHQDANNNGARDPGEDFRIIQLPETMGFGSGGAPLLRHLAGPVSFGASSGDPTLTFHRNGSASASGIVYFRPIEGSLAASAEGVRALTVERATGEIRCYSYRTGAWRDAC